MLTEEIYAKYLAYLGGIPFTKREIDVIACIAFERDQEAKIIARLLTITPKRVENLIGDIRSKVETKSGIKCNSKTKLFIFNFIEKSDKFITLKQYYQGLLINNIFEKELKKISQLIKNIINEKKYFLIYSNEQEKLNRQDKLPRLEKLKRNLKELELNISNEVIQSDKDLSRIIGNLQDETVNQIICCLPKTSEDQSSPSNTSLNPETPNFNKVMEIISTTAKLTRIEYFDLTIQENYYFHFFEVLKQLLMDVNIDSIIASFKKEHETLHKTLKEPVFLEPCMHQENDPVEKNKEGTLLENKQDVKEIKTNRRRSFLALNLSASLFFLTICILSFVFIKDIKKYFANITGFKNIISNNLMGTKEIASWNLPRQDHIFIGRKDFLKNLHDTLHKHNKDNSVNNKIAIAACAGLGGIGKTQLALQYAYHTNHPYTMRVWFPAENLDHLQQKYIEFAQDLGYTAQENSAKPAIKFVKSWLESHPGWLIIYDNVNNYEEIESLMPDKGGHIIVTTRNQHWPNNFKIIPIDVMNEDDATELIRSITACGKKNDEESAIKDLANTLGFLPLAISQASAYIQQTKISVSEYLKQYKMHEHELLSDPALPKGTNHLPVAVTWDITLEKILTEAKKNNQPPLAIHVLVFCAYMAPEGIPYNLLLNIFKENFPSLKSSELMLTKSIAQLRKYSMISGEDNKYITMHRVVQSVIRYQHANQHACNSKDNVHFAPLTIEWYNKLFNGTHIEFGPDVNSLEDEIRKKNLLPHLQSLLGYYEKNWSDEKNLNLAPILNDIGIAFFLSGDFKNAKYYFEKALPILEKHYGKNHLEIADVLINLGKTDRDLTYAKEAKANCQRAATILQQDNEQHNGQSIRLAQALDCIGKSNIWLGETKDAIVNLERALKIKRINLGNNHIEAMETLQFLGMAYEDYGDLKNAKNSHEQVVKFKEQYYGKHHAKMSLAINFLGGVYRLFGNIEEAKKLHERALEIEEKYYGKDRMDIHFTLDYLGMCYRELGDPEKALELHQRALEIVKNEFGKDKFVMAYTLDLLGCAYHELGEFNKAIESHQQALEINKNNYGENHPFTAFSYRLLGTAYNSLKDYPTSKEYLEKAREIYENHDGYKTNHPYLAITLFELAKTNKSLGEVNLAQTQLERALKMRIEHFGKNHRYTKEIDNSL